MTTTAGSTTESDFYLTGAFAPVSEELSEVDLSYVYDASRDRSDLIILDASDITAEPVATINLPQRVPYGFHGSWIDDTELP